MLLSGNGLDFTFLCLDSHCLFWFWCWFVWASSIDIVLCVCVWVVNLIGLVCKRVFHFFCSFCFSMFCPYNLMSYLIECVLIIANTVHLFLVTGSSHWSWMYMCFLKTSFNGVFCKLVLSFWCTIVCKVCSQVLFVLPHFPLVYGRQKRWGKQLSHPSFSESLNFCVFPLFTCSSSIVSHLLLSLTSWLGLKTSKPSTFISEFTSADYFSVQPSQAPHIVEYPGTGGFGTLTPQNGTTSRDLFCHRV